MSATSAEQAGHDHTHGMAKHTLRLAFFLTMIILAAEVTGGLLSHSLALLSDAGHVLTDIFALGLAWFATAQTERPADAQKTFGYHRVGILAALANAVTLLLITAGSCGRRFPVSNTPNPSSRWPCSFLLGLALRSISSSALVCKKRGIT